MTVTKPAKKPRARRKNPRCRICERAIYVPQGWSHGPAVRRHYWAKHRDVMRGASSKVER